ncbi:hypothetical protein [Mycobacterium colombiense]|uniref:hypothetical protein n=1 Tax=Mycobacterium colombiense TaxID=339268 RepID=UPI00096D6ED8|nr:hypothetical protein [Mycobacterium colombiense]OMB97090.1 hypothetical protein A5732_07780 [Mycobacterium colombiense]OMC22097.1 hypothetical protein A5737_22230 [Mycobacterium colombiense]OMC28008.1 hypothetical protein A5738_02065 [Mycobacterium colombiense]
MLRNDESGLATARLFFSPLNAHTRVALAGLTDADLTAAHRVFAALIDALRCFKDELDEAPKS